MLRPEKLCYLKIALHKSKIPAFLTEIPVHKMHIMEFKKEEKDLKPHHLRRQHLIHKDLEVLNQKITEIEGNLMYYFHFPPIRRG